MITRFQYSRALYNDVISNTPGILYTILWADRYMYLDVPGCTKYLQGPSHLGICIEVDYIYYVITGISSHRLIFMQELSNEL